jgi:hypothetical protein
MDESNNSAELNAKIDELIRSISALNDSVHKSADAAEKSARASEKSAKASEKSTKRSIDQDKLSRSRESAKTPAAASASIVDNIMKQFEKTAAVIGAKQAKAASNQARRAAADQGQSKTIQNIKSLDAFNSSLGKSAAAMANLNQSIGAVGKSFSALGKSLAAGNAGASDYAGAIKSVTDTAADAALLFSKGNPLIAGIALTLKAIAKLAGPVAKLADDQFRVYQQMADVGANTSQELAGVNTLLDNFGLGVENAGKMLEVLGRHAEGLSMAGGTVAKGAQRLGGVIKNLRDSGLQAELLNLGISYDTQRESAATYMDIQSRLGSAQSKSVKEMTESISKYLLEQDALTRATGASRKQQEAAQARAMNEEMFRNRQNKLRMSGQQEQADYELQVYKTLEAELGPELASQMGSMFDGIVNKFNEGVNVLTGMGAFDIAQQAAQGGPGRPSAGAVADMVKQQLKQNMGAGSIGDVTAGINTFQSQFGLKLGDISDKLYGHIEPLVTRLEAVGAEQDVTKGRPSAAVKGLVDIAEANIKIQRSLQNLLTLGVEPLAVAMGALAKVTGNVARALDVGPGTLKGPSRASGGIATGPKTGYPATLHGTEAVIPLGHGSIPLKITGGQAAIDTGTVFNAQSETNFLLDKNNQELLKSNIALEKILQEIMQGATELTSGSRSVTSAGGPGTAGAAPTGAGAAPISGELGTMSAKYESGSAGSMAVGRDQSGGTSYGKYQIASKVGSMDAFLKLLQKNDPEAHARLMGAGPQDAGVQGQFAQEWKKLVGEGRIQQSEREFAVEKIFQPAMKGVKDQDLSKMIGENKGLQEMMFSMAIQHGPGGAPAILNKVYKKGMKADELVNAAYEERGADKGQRYFGRSTENERAGVVSRFGRERQDVLALLGQPATGTQAPTIAQAPTAAGVQAPTAGAFQAASAAQAPASNPLANITQSIMGMFGLGGGPGAGIQSGIQSAVAGISAGGAPGAIGGDITAITQAMGTQTTATQTAITSGMENLTNQLVSKIGGGAPGTTSDPAVPSLLSEILSAQREQTSAINRLIQVTTA